jgi:hypothetical protein
VTIAAWPERSGSGQRPERSGSGQCRRRSAYAMLTMTMPAQMTISAARLCIPAAMPLSGMETPSETHATVMATRRSPAAIRSDRSRMSGSGAGDVTAPGSRTGGTEGGPAAATPPTPALPPQVVAAQLRALAGRWLSTAKSRDYFVFRADGAGAWMVRGRALWQGEVIPTGQGAYRLAWQTTMPNNAAYWHVTLLDGGRRLLFDGTRKVYRKV